MLFAPGAGWAYSNIGYLLLRRIIETVTRGSLRNSVHEHIVVPLELADTFVAETIQDWQSCVPGYGPEVRPDGALGDIRGLYHPGWCAPGVAVSTTEDVTQFYDSLLAGHVVEPPSLDRMLQVVRVPGTHPPSVTPSCGMGILADPDGPFGASFGHGGGGPGYSLSASILPRAANGRLSIALFCNSSAGVDAKTGEQAMLRVAVAVA